MQTLDCRTIDQFMAAAADVLAGVVQPGAVIRRGERAQAQREADAPARAALLGQAELLAHGADDPTSCAAASTTKRASRGGSPRRACRRAAPHGAN